MRRLIRQNLLLLGIVGAFFSSGPAPSRAEMVTVDLLVLYTESAAEAYADVDLRINHLVNVSNQAYAQSGIEMQLQVVHVEPVEWGDALSSYAALSQVSDPLYSPLGQLAAELRSEFAADMVVLMRGHANDGICGLAWIGGIGTEGVFGSFDRDYAFSLVVIDCSDYVMAHELGHNMGLHHSRLQDGRGGTFEYALGHGVEDRFVTMMAYRRPFGGRRIMKFSNPDRLCGSAPCGVPVGGRHPGRSADAARSLQMTRHQFAAYGEGAAIPPPPSLGWQSPERKATLRLGQELPLRWVASGGVESVRVEYRRSWSDAGEAAQDPEWLPIGAFDRDGAHDWTIPPHWPAHTTLTLRLVGLDANSEEIITTVTRPHRLRSAMP